MLRIHLLHQLLLLTVLILAGCAGHGATRDADIPTTPDLTVQEISIRDGAPRQESNPHSLWGMWWINIDPEEGAWEIVPARTSSIHLNIRKFLEDGVPCANCLQITSFVNNPDGTKSIDILITHPFPEFDLYTGFDVRAIAMWYGTEIWFGPPYLRTQDPYGTDAYVINADGYTNNFNPTHFPEGSAPPVLTYSMGRFATPAFPNSTLNPYLNYYTDVHRHYFRSGQSRTRTWEIRFPTGGPFTLGYAVDASWRAPNPSPPLQIPEDFPIEANMPEPYLVEPGQPGFLYPETGAETNLLVRVYDWQGNPGRVWAECPELWNGKKFDTLSVGIDDYVEFTVPIENEKGALTGFYRTLIAATDSTSGLPPFDSTTYVFTEIEVAGKCCANEPVAIIEAPSDVITGQVITLTHASYDPDGEDCLVVVNWDLNGDGLFDDATGDEVMVSWDEIGTQIVGLLAIDECDRYDIDDVEVEVHVGITQAEDQDYRTIGTRYSYVSADFAGPDAAFAVNLGNPNGPWDFTLLDLEDTGNHSAILGPDHPEVADFKDDFSLPYDHFMKNGGSHIQLTNVIYIPERFVTDPDRLMIVGFHDNDFGSVPTDPPMEPMEIPYPTWIFSDNEYTYGFGSIFNLEHRLTGWGEGMVSVPYAGIIDVPCVVIKHEVTIESTQFDASGICYEWIIDDGTIVAIVAAYNSENNTGFDPDTGVITGMAIFNALNAVGPY